MNIYLLYREEKELEREREGGAILAVSAAVERGGGWTQIRSQQK
jgi:hypothetical protein